jgi:hypothetical protein
MISVGNFLAMISEGDSIMTQLLHNMTHFCSCGALFCFLVNASVKPVAIPDLFAY